MSAARGPGDPTALLDRWSELARAARRAVEAGDGPGLTAILEQRQQTLVALASHRPLDPAITRRLRDVDREIETAIRELRDATAQELGQIRAVREKLRGRADRTRDPVFTSQRA